MDWYLISVIIFVAILGVIVYRDRKNWKFSLISTRKAKKYVNFLNKAARISTRFWKIIGIIAVIVCCYLLVQGLFIFFMASKLIFEGKITGPSGGIVIPYPQPTFQIGYGYILVPFWIYIFLLPLILIPHEFMHGILARAEKVKIKSAGLFFLLFIPGGAFVEQDQKSFNKAKISSRVKILAGGSFANFVMVFFLLLIATLSWPALVDSNGVYLINVTKDSPAYHAGLQAGMIITSVNGTPIQTSFSDWSLSLPKKPGEQVTFEIENRVYTLKTAEHPEDQEKPYLGITYTPLARFGWSLTYQFFLFLSWVILFEYWIAIFNIMPIYGLDGGLILRAIVERKLGKNWKKVVMPITWLMIALLLWIIIGPGLYEYLLPIE